MKQADKELHFNDYWRVVSKRRHVVMVLFALIVVLVSVYSFMATSIYRGTAQILFELEKNPTMSFSEGDSGYVQMKDTRSYFSTQKQIILSRTFADRVVRKLELDKNAYFIKKKDAHDGGGLIGGLLKSIKEILPASSVDSGDPFPNMSTQDELEPTLTDLVLMGVSVDLSSNGNILKVNYDSDNPKVAAVMANGIAATYIEHNLEIRVKPYRDAKDWLSARIVDLRSRVEGSQRTLQEYKEGEGIASFEANKNVVTQEYGEIVSQLVKVEARRQDAEVRYNQIKGVIDSPELLSTVPDIMNNLVIQNLRNEELKLKKDMKQLSEKYGAKHPRMIKVTTELDEVQRNLISEARKMLNSAKTEYEIAVSKEDFLKKRRDEQKEEVLGLSRKAIEFNVVAGEALSNKQFYEILLQKHQEAMLSSGINVSNAQVVDRAIIPDSPMSPDKLSNIMIASFIGLFFGVAGAFFTEYMDDTLKTSSDVEDILGLPFLCYIPSFLIQGKDIKKLPVVANPKSVVAEAYRTLRTGIIFSSAEKSLGALLVTSSIPAEGKTTTAANMAVSMAQTGERVLLIDADMRNHNVHKIFDMPNDIGLSNFLIGDKSLEESISKVSGVDNLHIITAGALTPNPSELLSSNKMKELVSKAHEDYDRIILDSPPVMPVADPLILSSIVDGVVMVVGGGTTSKDTVIASAQSLSGVKAKVVGVVLNNMSTRKSDLQQYYPYYHSYGDATEEKS